MKAFRAGALACACVVLSAVPARAEGFISPFVGFNYGGDVAGYCASLRECEEKRTAWGVAFGSTGSVFGFEADFAYASHFFGEGAGAGDNGVLTFMTNMLITVPAGPIQPYGLVGIGLIRSHVKELRPSALDLTNNSLGWDIGGGINIYFARSVGIRGDIRRMRTMDSITLGLFADENLDFWRASAGLTLRF